MKVLTVVGARPQFIKCSAVSRELRRSATEILVHTGQHYDNNMSEVFFSELEIPEPDYNLGIGSGSHGAQTGKMLEAIEKVLQKEQPDWVLVYGDTNSTLAGALAAAKSHVPVAHVEAGLRSYNRKMPEEINRVVTDHLSKTLFCPTECAIENLHKEGIVAGVHLVGDVMYDAMMRSLVMAEEKSTILKDLHLMPKGYYLITVHRAENTDDEGRLLAIMNAIEEISTRNPVVWPMHPRTRHTLEGRALMPRLKNVTLIEPQSYLSMLALEKNAAAILTDSGGVQKEACWLEVPCITLREETEWLETTQSGWNVLVGTDPTRIRRAVGKIGREPLPAPLTVSAGAASRIAELIMNDRENTI